MLRFFILLFLANFCFSENNAFNPEKWEKNNSHYNPDVYYNIGIYYIKQGNTAKAILNLKRASLLSPEDKKIKDMLNNERRKLDVPVLSYEPSIIEKIFSFPFNIFSINGTFIFGIIFLSMGSIIISLILIKPSFLSRMKNLYDKKFLISGIIIFTIGFIYCIVSFIRYNMTFDKKEGVVLVDDSLYDIPSMEGVKISELKAGTEIKIVKSENEYYLITTLSGKEGYIKTNSVERLWQ
ncbi:MAG: hypothetical protein ACP5Q5_04250 [Brevinematia bacterium]